MSGTVEVYRAKRGWRWRLRAGNHKTIADSAESYTQRRHAERAARTFRSTSLAARLVVDGDEVAW